MPLQRTLAPVLSLKCPGFFHAWRKQTGDTCALHILISCIVFRYELKPTESSERHSRTRAPSPTQTAVLAMVHHVRPHQKPGQNGFCQARNVLESYQKQWQCTQTGSLFCLFETCHMCLFGYMLGGQERRRGKGWRRRTRRVNATWVRMLRLIQCLVAWFSIKLILYHFHHNFSKKSSSSSVQTAIIQYINSTTSIHNQDNATSIPRSLLPCTQERERERRIAELECHLLVCFWFVWFVCIAVADQPLPAASTRIPNFPSGVAARVAPVARVGVRENVAMISS